VEEDPAQEEEGMVVDEFGNIIVDDTIEADVDPDAEEEAITAYDEFMLSDDYGGYFPQRNKPHANFQTKLRHFKPEKDAEGGITGVLLNEQGQPEEVEVYPKWHKLQQTDKSVAGELGCLLSKAPLERYKDKFEIAAEKKGAEAAEKKRRKELGLPEEPTEEELEEEAAEAEAEPEAEPEAPSRVWRYNEEAFYVRQERVKVQEAMEAAEYQYGEGKAAFEQAKQDFLESSQKVNAVHTEWNEAEKAARMVGDHLVRIDDDTQGLQGAADGEYGEKPASKAQEQIRFLEAERSKAIVKKEGLDEQALVLMKAHKDFMMEFGDKEAALQLVMEDAQQVMDTAKEASDAAGAKWVASLDPIWDKASLEHVRRVYREIEGQNAQAEVTKAEKDLEACPADATLQQALQTAKDHLKVSAVRVEHFPSTTSFPGRPLRAGMRAPPRMPNERVVPEDLSTDTIRTDLPAVRVRRDWMLEEDSSKQGDSYTFDAKDPSTEFTTTTADDIARERMAAAEASVEASAEETVETGSSTRENNYELSWLEKRMEMNDLARQKVIESNLKWSTKPGQELNARLEHHTPPVAERLASGLNQGMQGSFTTYGDGADEAEQNATFDLPFEISDRFHETPALSMRPESIPPRFSNKALYEMQTAKEVQHSRQQGTQRSKNPYRPAWYRK